MLGDRSHRGVEWPDNDFRLFVGDLGKEVSRCAVFFLDLAYFAISGEHRTPHTSFLSLQVLCESESEKRAVSELTFANPIPFR